MRRTVAAAGSALFFALAPAIVAGVLPWLLTGWRSGDYPGWLGVPARVLGAALLTAAASVLVYSFVRFVVEGLGTPAPIAPPTRLVVGGAYRYVRNPMYLAVVAAILGQALLLGRLELLWYAAAVGAATAAFAYGYEEPALRRQFGAEYEAYRRAVPAWRPRLRPWRGTD
ncbi:MAG TPA: methyltransferase [Micromonosporaceae bacterium]|jgi:protein-S-isoprenylcysteine O-methyltransferase Ste14